MSGSKPSFITGASAKIKVAGKTMAYAQDVSYSVTVTTIPIETMGRYEVVSNEPVAYFVDGSFSIIRYTAEAKTNLMQGTDASGNSVNEIGIGGGFDPGLMIASTTFDLEIFQKFTSATSGAGVTAPAAAVAASGAAAAVAAVIGTTLVMKLRDCRCTRMGGAINKRGILVEQFSFNAILADSGGTAASHSGDIDLAP